MNTQYFFPEDLSKTICNKLKSDENISIDSELLTKIINIVYLASMETDEGYLPSFSVIFKIPQNEIPKDFELWSFSEARYFNLNELRLLARTTEDNSMGIFIQSEENEVFVKGFINFDLINTLIRKESNHLYDLLIIKTFSPGNIKVYLSEKLIASLSSGKIYIPPPVLISNYFGIYRYLKNGIESFKQYYKKSSIKEWYGIEWVTYINIYLSVVNQIIGKNHGGTLLVIDDSNTIDSIANMDKSIYLKLKCKYKLDKSVNELLKNKFINLCNSFYNRDVSTDFLYEKDNLLKNSIHFIGNLSLTDGAVLMTNSLKVIGFGTEILPENTEDIKVYEYNNLEHYDYNIIDIEQFGMRHRSAIKFCFFNRNSFAFIVSQDGHTSLCWNNSGNVFLKRDLNQKKSFLEYLKYK